MSVYMIEKKFGRLAVQMGYITHEQLTEAMHLQLQEDLSRRPHRLVGLILKDVGHMDVAQVNRVLAAMNFPIEFCRRHLEFAHPFDLRPQFS